MDNYIYLDHAATTPLAPEVIDVMTSEMKDNFGNASSTHRLGRQARQKLEEARRVIAKSIVAQPHEIVFTSGGSESDNTAIIETALKRQNLGKHLITTQIEHQAVLKSMAYLESLGFEVTYLPVNSTGVVDIADLKRALREDTILVSIMMVNNEVGSIMPMHEIGELLSAHQAWFHTDAVQGYGLFDIDVKRDQIDLLSVSAHKINGPKFLGFLYINESISLPSLIHGGEQESKRRAGTENIPAIVGFQKAVELLTTSAKKRRNTRYNHFKSDLITKLNENNIAFDINGDVAQASSHVISLWIKGIDTNILQMGLDLAGIAVSGGSACTAGNLEPSHVLIAMYGESSPRVAESIRLSFGVTTTNEEITIFIDQLQVVIQRAKRRQN